MGKRKIIKNETKSRSYTLLSTSHFRDFYYDLEVKLTFDKHDCFLFEYLKSLKPVNESTSQEHGWSKNSKSHTLIVSENRKNEK